MEIIKPRVSIVEATPALHEAVSMILIRQMAEVLRNAPMVDLCDEERCIRILMRAGFGSGAVVRLLRRVQYRAWYLADPVGAARWTRDRDEERRFPT